MARNPRLMTPATRLAAMEAADAARRAAVKVCAEAPIGSENYKAAVRILEALGDLAKMLARTTAKTQAPGFPPGLDSIGIPGPGIH